MQIFDKLLKYKIYTLIMLLYYYINDDNTSKIPDYINKS